jgi:hypothetical protein
LETILSRATVPNFSNLIHFYKITTKKTVSITQLQFLCIFRRLQFVKTILITIHNYNYLFLLKIRDNLKLRSTTGQQWSALVASRPASALKQYGLKMSDF